MQSATSLVMAAVVIFVVLAVLGLVAAYALGTSSVIVVGVGLGATVGAFLFSVAVFAWSLGETLVARENTRRIFDALRDVARDGYTAVNLTDEELQAVANARGKGESEAALDIRGAFRAKGQGKGQGKHARVAVLGDGDVWWVTHAGGPGSAGKGPKAQRSKPGGPV